MRTNNAKEWQPNTDEKEIIDKIAKFVIVSEHSTAYLHFNKFPEIEKLWLKVQAEFLGNPAKYPAHMAEDLDVEGRKKFLVKCEAMCFPPTPPLSPEE